MVEISKMFFVLLGSLLLCAVGGAEEAFRTFTSADGRKMEARLLMVSQGDVRIERKGDLQHFKLQIERFSKEDQRFIKTWDEMKRLSREDALEVKIRRSRSDRDSKASISTKTKTWKAGYTIRVANETVGSFLDLEVRYRIFKFDQAVAAQDRGDGTMKRMSGSFKIDRLEPDEWMEHDTEQFDMSASQLKENWYYIGGGRKRSKDELDGCWVRIYKGNDLVHEYALPAGVMREQSWDK